MWKNGSGILDADGVEKRLYPKLTKEEFSAMCKDVLEHHVQRCWLLKSEPDVYSIDQLKKDRKTGWTGVRNYQARNFMRDSMKPDDFVLFYHSNSDPKAIVGTAKVSKVGLPDPTQFDPKSEYYDPKSKRENPTWMMAEIQYITTFKRPVTLDELKRTPGLEEMMVIQRGSRLSVQPVKTWEWEIVLKLGGIA